MYKPRLQSAMEYLMTYGWAILVIAVVIAALFSLGVFNGANFAPRAQPGSCRVFKTAAGINLVGQCNGFLPQYVAQFNGQSSYVDAGNVVNLDLQNTITLSAWVNPNVGSGQQGVIGTHGFLTAYSLYLRHELGMDVGASFVTGSNNEYLTTGAGATINYGRWNYVAMTFDGTTFKVYVNGVKTFNTASISGTVTRDFQGLYIGYTQSINPPNFLSGSIANVQIYNTSLSADQVQYLYMEGIGGAPISLQNLVGWWPLNGDTNDYSGNNNGGVPTNVVYTNSWTSGYNPP
jgi:hypothetical protein